MINKFFILVFIFCLIHLTSIGQSGYLGSNNSLNIELGTAMVFNNSSTRVDQVQLNGTTKVKYQPTQIKFNISSSYSRVINDSYRIDLGLRFSHLDLVTPYFTDTIPATSGYNFNNYRLAILNTIPIKYIIGFIGFTKFYAGHSPVGKYWGLSLGYGNAQTSTSIPLKLGILYGKQINGTEYTYDVLHYREKLLSYQGNVDIFSLTFNLGTTIPLTSKLGIDLSLKTSLLQLYKFNDTYTTNYALDDASLIDHTSSYGLNRQIAFTIRNSNWFHINFGLRYFI